MDFNKTNTRSLGRPILLAASMSTLLLGRPHAAEASVLRENERLGDVTITGIQCLSSPRDRRGSVASAFTHSDGSVWISQGDIRFASRIHGLRCSTKRELELGLSQATLALTTGSAAAACIPGGAAAGNVSIKVLGAVIAVAQYTVRNLDCSENDTPEELREKTKRIVCEQLIRKGAESCDLVI